MELLFSWAEEQLHRKKGLPLKGAIAWEIVSGDASFRRYYRAKATNDSGQRQSWIAVYAPPEKEKNHEFVAIAEAFSQVGVRTPDIFAADYRQGFLLQEDFGDQLLLPLLNKETVDSYYSQSIDVLLQLQGLDLDKQRLPSYDRKMLQAELLLFPQWFLGGLLKLEVSPQETLLLSHTFDDLLNSALAQPQVCVHRDFHSRNLMILPDKQIGVIDFQDAVAGPITYDLVSLLRDCYICWPTEKIAQWLELYQTKGKKQGLLSGVSSDQFTLWFDWMGVQRHLKVLGIFARLALRDGKDSYLNDIPLVMHYVLRVCQQYPALSDFSDWFETQVLPLAREQSWFKDVIK